MADNWTDPYEQWSPEMQGWLQEQIKSQNWGAITQGANSVGLSPEDTLAAMNAAGGVDGKGG